MSGAAGVPVSAADDDARPGEGGVGPDAWPAHRPPPLGQLILKLMLHATAHTYISVSLVLCPLMGTCFKRVAKVEMSPLYLL